jgi:hypothetical protein
MFVTSQPGLLFSPKYNLNMASKESFATNEEKDESFGSKEQVIEPYMFEPNKGEHGEASDDSSEDSGSEEDESSYYA